MVKPTAHNSFYKCSNHFSLNPSAEIGRQDNLKFYWYTRVGSNPSSDIWGYGLIGKTRTLQVLYSGSIPDNSKILARKAQLVERNTEDV